MILNSDAAKPYPPSKVILQLCSHVTRSNKSSPMMSWVEKEEALIAVY